MRNPLKIDFDPQKRIYGLDVFRAIAILIVVLVHGNLIIHKKFPDFPWIKLIDGVELFFVLSGFLIGSILIKEIEKESKFSFSTCLKFWKRRWFRTLPNYFLFLVFNILLAYFELNTWKFEEFNWKFFVFAQNLATPFSGFFLESWSLSIEEWFYLLLPLLFIVFALVSTKRTAFLLSTLALITVPLVYRISIADINVDYYWWDVTFRKTVITRLDTIGFGVLASYLHHHYNSTWVRYKTPLFIVGITLLIVELYLPKAVNDFYTKTFHFTVISIGIALLLPLASQIRSYSTSLGNILTKISIISYSMYLINLSIVALILLKNFEITSSNALFYYVLYWMLTVLFSAIVYNYFEKPIMDLRDKF